MTAVTRKVHETIDTGRVYLSDSEGEDLETPRSVPGSILVKRFHKLFQCVTSEAEAAVRGTLPGISDQPALPSKHVIQNKPLSIKLGDQRIGSVT